MSLGAARTPPLYATVTMNNQFLLCNFKVAFQIKFQCLDWEKLAKRRILSPFIPKITDELDVSNFAEEFTAMVPTDSPAIIPPNVDKIFKVS